MSDLVLVFPKTGVDIMPTIAPPHSVMAIATLPVQAGYKVRIIDQRLEHNWREILRRELETRPVLVGISAMTGNQIQSGLEVARFVRGLNDQIPIVWGGPHPSMLPEQTLATNMWTSSASGKASTPSRTSRTPWRTAVRWRP